MGEYHRYVFDHASRKFVGRFEEMYQAEEGKGFDSWHQDDVRYLHLQICLDILDRYNFSNILDIGCGKGAFTQFLKKQNNNVTGLDISATAIARARARYPDISFQQCDVDSFYNGWKSVEKCGRYDLITCIEVLSYVKNWQMVIENFSMMSSFALIKLFIPDNPMGYVKSIDDLFNEFRKYFEIIEDIRMIKRQHYILFGRSLKPEK